MYFIRAFQNCFYILCITLLFDTCDAAGSKKVPPAPESMQKHIDTNKAKTDENVETKDVSSIKNLPPTNMKEYIDSYNKNLDNMEIVCEAEKVITLEKLRGNIVIIVFSTTWCSNCPNVLQEFDNLLNKVKEKGIADIKIIALNVGEEDVNEIKVHYKMHDIQILDVYKSVDNSVIRGIRGVPACLIFNPQGKLVWGYLGGGIDFSSDSFLSSLNKLRK